MNRFSQSHSSYYNFKSDKIGPVENTMFYYEKTPLICNKVLFQLKSLQTQNMGKSSTNQPPPNNTLNFIKSNFKKWISKKFRLSILGFMIITSCKHQNEHDKDTHDQIETDSGSNEAFSNNNSEPTSNPQITEYETIDTEYTQEDTLDIKQNKKQVIQNKKQDILNSYEKITLKDNNDNIEEEKNSDIIEKESPQNQELRNDKELQLIEIENSNKEEQSTTDDIPVIEKKQNEDDLSNILKKEIEEPGHQKRQSSLIGSIIIPEWDEIEFKQLKIITEKAQKEIIEITSQAKENAKKLHLAAIKDARKNHVETNEYVASKCFKNMIKYSNNIKDKYLKRISAKLNVQNLFISMWAMKSLLEIDLHNRACLAYFKSECKPKSFREDFMKSTNEMKEVNQEFDFNINIAKSSNSKRKEYIISNICRDLHDVMELIYTRLKEIHTTFAYEGSKTLQIEYLFLNMDYLYRCSLEIDFLPQWVIPKIYFIYTEARKLYIKSTQIKRENLMKTMLRNKEPISKIMKATNFSHKEISKLRLKHLKEAKRNIRLDRSNLDTISAQSGFSKEELLIE